mmetsp:Transcript_7376/g.11800  ORF Transcript_7376/g.11800 Transcript_7376/m.11800 type:complete len:728 (+) Transcript_7376:45-2228(+)|eukprot:CAMPEP_0203757578 /NCGR_PEP_ID=MMETSP0098-20131031/10576_1 /ASSEMBLY_ACC=CAM_ASM_000208 /TAXON_ID=96639 /ORGANISM=" , Strain NY0313808BC1" /LENGTH=727 /DNA_ID=CAMNT_0050649799 /DNA_START=43 /DNA_END=2226 /DNA_ORIENTATION=-
MKPFRSTKRINDEEATKIWEGLRHAIREIHNHNAGTLSFEELYRNAYNLVLHKHGEKLYGGIEREVRAYLTGIGNQIACASDDTLLSVLVEKWNDHTTTMTMIRDILMYMDKTFVVQHNKDPVYELGLKVFQECVVRHPNVKGRVLGMVLANIENERNGELIDRDVIRRVLQILVDLGIKSPSFYESFFEQEFLRVTKQFYRQEALEYIQVNTCPDYVLKAESRLEEELARAHHYLHSSTESKLLTLVGNEMVVAHASQLVAMPNSGCRMMIRDDKLEDLARMYRLFGVKNCRAEIKNCMSEYVKECGSKLVDGQENDKKPVDFVKDLLDLQEKYDKIVKMAFYDDKFFHKAVKEAFEEFINKNQRCSRYLSMYLDDLMRNRIQVNTQNDTELNLLVDRVVVLFRYLQDKDVFENFYKQQLAKRLLSARSFSEEAESSIIKKLKTECGYLFTSKLEGMFKDMKLSKETMEKYHAKLPKIASQAQVELQVTVLTAGFWPTEGATPCKLPQQVVPQCETFSEFYLGCHSGRRLTWQTNLGNANIKARFTDKVTHEFNVSTYQMCCLLLFNNAETLTFAQIMQMTGIQDVTELKRHLISLAAPKFRILKKEPKGKVIDDDTKFFVNAEFSSKHYKLRIPLISASQNLSSKRDIPEQVEEDRKHLVEAAIVRIMKARKTLEHNLLVAEVTKQISHRFRPEVSQIKKRIESLIEREYLERSPEDRKMYNYLA